MEACPGAWLQLGPKPAAMLRDNLRRDVETQSRTTGHGFAAPTVETIKDMG